MNGMNGKILKLLVGIFAVGALIPGSLTRAEEAIGDPESERYSELEKARSSFKETWVLPGVDFSEYDTIYFWAGQFEYRDVGPAESSSSYRNRTRKREFGISEEDRREFEQIVGDAFRNEIEKGKHFTIADEVGPDTLILRGALLDVVSNVPPPTTGRTETYLATIGEATLVMEIMDSETGTVLALVSQRKKIQPPGGGQIDRFSMQANRVTVTADIKRWASSAASQLRKELDKAMK